MSNAFIKEETLKCKEALAEQSALPFFAIKP